MKRQIGVIGLGKLGSCLAACLASSSKNEVLGYDVNPRVVDVFRDGAAHVNEPGLADLIHRVRGSLFTTTNLAELALVADVVFVVVPTPSETNGRFSNAHVIDAVKGLARSLPSNADGFTLVITSTVMPGSCGGPIRKAFESARRSVELEPRRTSLVYSPEFIALGSVIHDLTHPDIILMGCDDERGNDRVSTILLELVDPLAAPPPTVHAMGLLDAELSKLALNVALSVKIAYANEVAQVAERIGADGVRVLGSVGDDSRIGRKFLLPGAPPSGPCLPRDLHAFSQLAAEAGMHADMAEGARFANSSLVSRTYLDLVDRAGTDRPVLGVLGVTYKVGSNITDESLGAALALTARATGCEVVIWDPVAARDDQYRWVDDAQTVVDEADVIVVATPWPECRTLDYRGKPVIDFWGIAPQADGIHRFGIADR